jgi:endonuclease/exonuclease/phosphatase (EEP) superfamily protein YafD
MVKKYRKYLMFNLLVLSCLSSVRYFDNLDSRLVDLVSHFPFQYAVLSFVIFTICLWKRIVSLAVLAVFLFVVNVSALVSPGESIMAAEKAGATFSVYSSNVSKFNKDFSSLSEDLNNTNADIVLLLEITPAHISKLNTLARHFRYHIVYTPVGTYKLGVALLSKFPILDNKVKKLSQAGNVMLEATLNINNKKVIFLGTHSQNPVFVKDFSERKRQFLELGQYIYTTSLPVIVAGDFNATPFSPIFRELINISGLKDTRLGFGWQPSWPTYAPIFWLPIDHILVSHEFQVINRATGSFIGSDHYPVFAELSID